MGKKVSIVCNLNCSRREMDMAKLEVYLKLNGYEVIKEEEKADYIVVTSCGFINDTARMALEQVKRVKKYNAEIIVTGCVPDTDVEKLHDIFQGELIHNTELQKFDDFFCNLYKWDDIPEVHDMSWGKEYFCVEVSRGCPENCSYCATRWAVGKLRSKTIEKCKDEVVKFNASDKNKVVINGDNVGAYGLDIKETFGTLMNALPLQDNQYSALIDSLHPKWLLRYYNEILEAASKNRLGMIVSAIQAGSERVIKLMNRGVDMKELERAFISIKEASPNMILGTEVIVGFPTETESELEESIDFVLKTGIDWGHLFAFSPKDGTNAAAMEGQIDEEEKKSRINYFIERLKEKDYVVHKEEKSQAVIFCKKTICMNASKNENVYWQHCFDTICLDRNKQAELILQYQEEK